MSIERRPGKDKDISPHKKRRKMSKRERRQKQKRLKEMGLLKTYMDTLDERDRVFARNLSNQFDLKDDLSNNQWGWVSALANRVVERGKQHGST